MKKRIILILPFLCLSVVYAQNEISYKIKNQFNSEERSQILNVIRNKFQSELIRSYNYKKKISFVVKQLNVFKDYAWFEGDIVDEKGNLLPEELVGSPEEGNGLTWNSCGEALLKKKNKKWAVIESIIFPTIPWWGGLKVKYSDIPCDIFVGTGGVAGCP